VEEIAAALAEDLPEPKPPRRSRRRRRRKKRGGSSAEASPAEAAEPAAQTNDNESVTTGQANSTE
jgi:hypothetical protein